MYPFCYSTAPHPLLEVGPIGSTMPASYGPRWWRHGHEGFKQVSILHIYSHSILALLVTVPGAAEWSVRHILVQQTRFSPPEAKSAHVTVACTPEWPCRKWLHNCTIRWKSFSPCAKARMCDPHRIPLYHGSEHKHTHTLAKENLDWVFFPFEGRVSIFIRPVVICFFIHLKICA